MLKMIATSAAVLMIVTAAPVAPAKATQITPYDRCMLSAVFDCYPIGDLGPYIPTPGSPEEAIYDQCVIDRQAGCAGLEGDPNG